MPRCMSSWGWWPVPRAVAALHVKPVQPKELHYLQAMAGWCVTQPAMAPVHHTKVSIYAD